MSYQLTDGRFKAFDNAGAALVGGKLFTYSSGTTTAKATYVDAALTTPNTQPVLLNARGEAPVWLAQGAYSLTLKDAMDAIVWTLDNVGDNAPLQFIGGIGGGDDAPALMALANANTGRRIINALGNQLHFYSECIITAEDVTFDLNGGAINQHVPNINSITIKPPTAGVTAAFHNGGGIHNGSISHNLVADAATSGYGLNVVQCNGFRCTNMTFNDGDLNIAGGQLNRFLGCSFFASHGTYRGDGSACVTIREAAYGAGLFQTPFTIIIDDWYGSATKLRDAVIRICAGDGVLIDIGYGAFGNKAIVLFLAERDGSHIASCTVNGYLDCVNPSTGTLRAIEIRADGFAGSTVYGLKVDAWMGNGQEVGVLIRKPEVQAVSIKGQIVNMKSWAVDADSGPTIFDLILESGLHIQNCGGDGISGGVRLANGHTYKVHFNIHNTPTICLNISGSWRAGTISGCTNGLTTTPDVVDTATYVYRRAMSGNASAYTADPQYSWSIHQELLFVFANNAAALAGGLQIGMHYRNGDNVCTVH